MIRLIALVLPLALDTFAVSAALGVAGITGRQRMRLGLLFAGFEGGMPLVGLAVGAAVGTVVGGVADYVAIVALTGLGVYMLLADEDKEQARVARFASATGFALVAVGLTVSLDELAIGRICSWPGAGANRARTGVDRDPGVRGLAARFQPWEASWRVGT